MVVTLSAWGDRGPWAGRRGFDSLVQAACGIAVAEGAPDAPGALPAQALDHITGYLVAAGALLGLDRQRRDGGSHLVRLSLIGTASWLQDLPRSASLDIEEIDPTPVPAGTRRPGRSADRRGAARQRRAATALARSAAVLRHRSTPLAVTAARPAVARRSGGASVASAP